MSSVKFNLDSDMCMNMHLYILQHRNPTLPAHDGMDMSPPIKITGYYFEMW